MAENPFVAVDPLSSVMSSAWRSLDAFAQWQEKVPSVLAQSFVDSAYGLSLCDRWPPGTLHRGTLAQLDDWQKRYAPTVKRRTPKHRKRKRG